MSVYTFDNVSCFLAPVIDIVDPLFVFVCFVKNVRKIELHIRWSLERPSVVRKSPRVEKVLESMCDERHFSGTSHSNTDLLLALFGSRDRGIPLTVDPSAHGLEEFIDNQDGCCPRQHVGPIVQRKWDLRKSKGR